MLFVVNNLKMNGGSTFLIRYLSFSNHNSVLVLNKLIDKEVEDEVLKFSNILYLEDYFYFNSIKPISKLYFFSFWFVNYKKLVNAIQDSHFHSLGIFGLIFSVMFTKHKKIKISIGIYHFNELVFDNITKNIFTKFFFHNKNVGIIFFNNFCKINYENYFKTKFSFQRILPIGIVSMSQNFTKSIRRNEIISVGNLNKFKTYNEHVIRSLPQLLKKHDIKYIIYGKGENYIFLKNLVISLKLTNNVEFKGNLKYSDFYRIVSESYLFVGSGTAVIEAASSGTISITGIDSCPSPLSYGFVSDIVDFDYNEYDISKRKIIFYDLIDKVFSMSTNDYHKLSNDGVVKSRDFDITNTVKGFIDFEQALLFVEYNFSIFIFIFKLLLYFIYIGTIDLLGISNKFRLRRN